MLLIFYVSKPTLKRANGESEIKKICYVEQITGISWHCRS